MKKIIIPVKEGMNALEVKIPDELEDFVLSLKFKAVKLSNGAEIKEIHFSDKTI